MKAEAGLLISVIVPVYKVEKYLRQCLDSIVNQTYRDIEVLLIDDGSPDQCGAICDEYAKTDPRIRVIHNKTNQGLFRSREIGLSFATGDYIGWVDADDYVKPQMFEALYNAAVENDSELVICDYAWFPRKVATKSKWFREYKGAVDTTFVEQNSQVWNKLVKHELLERLEIGKHFVSCFDEIYIRVLMEAKNPVTIKLPLYNYRVGTGTLSSSYKDVAHYRAFVEASKELREVMTPVIHDTYWKDYFDYRVVYYLLMTMVVAANSGDKESYEKNQEELNRIEPKYNKNQHFWKILNINCGKIKALVIGRVIPINYKYARIASTAFFRGHE